MLVAKDTTVRVTDFGLSRLRQDTEEAYATTKSNVGPVVRCALMSNFGITKSSTSLAQKWMAPEAITKRIYSEKSDAWSFGVLVRSARSFSASIAVLILLSDTDMGDDHPAGAVAERGAARHRNRRRPQVRRINPLSSETDHCTKQFRGWTLKIPKNCDPFFKKLMKDCWKQQPDKRFVCNEFHHNINFLVVELTRLRSLQPILPGDRSTSLR